MAKRRKTRATCINGSDTIPLALALISKVTLPMFLASDSSCSQNLIFHSPPTERLIWPRF